MILERLPDETITPAHPNTVKYYVAQIAKAMDKHPAPVYSALYSAFQVPHYQELREDQWDQIKRWFQMPLGNVRDNQQPEQKKLL
ncbi:MAG: hypothetical protein ACRDHW_13170 [Ktedonobacteraceae bacterium]